jgi:hypothetical protein
MPRKNAPAPGWEVITWQIGERWSLFHLRTPGAPTALCGETIFEGDHQVYEPFGPIPGPDPAAHVSAYFQRQHYCLGCADMLGRGRARDF